MSTNIHKVIQNWEFGKAGAADLTTTKKAFKIAHLVLQTGPHNLFANRFSPQMHQAVLRAEDNPGMINIILNYTMLMANVSQDNYLASIVNFLQFYVDDETNSK